MMNLKEYENKIITAGVSYVGDDRKEFLAVLNNQLAGE